MRAPAHVARARGGGGPGARGAALGVLAAGRRFTGPGRPDHRARDGARARDAVSSSSSARREPSRCGAGSSSSRASRPSSSRTSSRPESPRARRSAPRNGRGAASSPSARSWTAGLPAGAFAVPSRSLLSLSVPAWTEAQCPLCREGRAARHARQPLRVGAGIRFRHGPEARLRLLRQQRLPRRRGGDGDPLLRPRDRAARHHARLRRRVAGPDGRRRRRGSRRGRQGDRRDSQGARGPGVGAPRPDGAAGRGARCTSASSGCSTSSDAFVAFPGGFGTMEEILEMLTWKQIGIHGKPIVLANIGGYFDPLLAQFEAAIKSKYARAGGPHPVRRGRKHEGDPHPARRRPGHVAPGRGLGLA